MRTRESTYNVLDDVRVERKRQDKRWGEQNHDDGVPLYPKQAVAELTVIKRRQDLHLTWADILWEEFTEAREAIGTPELRAELVQVAAVAVAWIESLDRRSQ